MSAVPWFVWLIIAVVVLVFLTWAAVFLFSLRLARRMINEVNADFHRAGQHRPPSNRRPLF